MRLEADRVDASVRSTTSGHLLQGLVYVRFLIVDDVGRAGFFGSHLQTVGVAIDRDHPFCAKELGARNRELPDWTRTPNRDDLPGLNVAHLCAHVAGGKDIGQEEYLLIAQVSRHLDRANVGKRDARVLRLSARKTAQKMGITEDPARG